MEKIIGKIKINNEDTVDITDPCYSKDTWCRINGVKLLEGEYLCKKCYSEFNGDELPTSIELINANYTSEFNWETLGGIEIDAGLVGFFVNKPDFSDDEWREFVGSLWKEKYQFCWVDEDKKWFWRDRGDGYCVVQYAKDENGNIIGLKI